jgi:parallel beta-helix repeat protein
MRPPFRTVALALLLAGCLLGCRKAPQPPPGKVLKVLPGPKAQEEAQKALIEARPGDTVEFGEGTFEFTAGLSLAVENVTVRGQGMDKTILSFRQQGAGSEGLLVKRGRFVLEDLSVEDAKGNGVKVFDVDGVTLRRVRARWTGGEKESNGAYGLYPLGCQNVLIEGCEAYGASDAGIYVGQSRRVIVRGCRAERNVAGIEIENSEDVDVHDNVATNNAGGLLVFDLPDLPVKNGRRVRVFDNRVVANNHKNFAPKGNMVAIVAPGTGMMVMATDQVEVFRNTLKDNQTYNLAIVSYHLTGRPIEDKEYDPIPEGTYVHDNTFSGGGDKPGGPMGPALVALLGEHMPDIIYDGIHNPTKMVDGKLPAPLRLYIKNNGGATFANLHWSKLPDLKKMKNDADRLVALGAHQPKVERDLRPYEGELPPLPPVTLAGAP